MPRRTAQSIAQTEGKPQQTETAPEKYPLGKHPNSLANLKPYKSGAEWEGNRKGPKRSDVAARICQQLFEGNEEQIYAALAREIIAKGSAYAFQVASDRAYGKLKQTQVHTGDEDGGPINASIKIEFVKPESKE